VISQLDDGSLTVSNESPDPVLLKKSCQMFSLYTTSPTNISSPLDIPPMVEKPLQDIMKDFVFDGAFPDKTSSLFLTSVAPTPTLATFAKLFQTILHRIETADIRIKPSKLKLNLQSADILGLHCHRGKLDPLAQCEPPKTVSALRSSGWKLRPLLVRRW